MKIKSVLKNNKYIYTNLIKCKSDERIIIFLSGFSGSTELPLFKKVAARFLSREFSILRVNFCNDEDDTVKRNDALNTKDLSFFLYEQELENIIKRLKYKKIVIVGHSFGAIIGMLFLKKYPKYKKITQLVFWDPTLLPWEEKYLPKKITKIFSKEFISDLTKTDSSAIFKKINKKTCIISAKNSADTDSKKYAKGIPANISPDLFVIKNTNHFFSSKKAQEQLVEITTDYLNGNN